MEMIDTQETIQQAQTQPATQVEEVAQESDNELMDQLYQMQEQIRQQQDEQSQQMQQLRQMLIPEEERINQSQIDVLKQQLGLNKIQELQSQIQEMKEQHEDILKAQMLSQAQQGFNALHQKYPNITKEAIARELMSISNENKNLGVALDNPAGWELIYLARLANTQPTPDQHISSQNQTHQSDLQRLKQGDMSFEEIGKLF